jgi:hypothetical protein
MSRRPYHLALFFISSALLSFEISLMRMLRVEGFGNFTYGAIALALTGFGASGTILSLVREKIKGREQEIAFWSPVFFCLFLGFGYWCSTHVHFDALRILWDASQLLRLLIRYLLYTVPFIIGSAFVVLSFSIGNPGRMYAFNLTGSGFGIMAVLAGMHFITPARILIIPMLLALLSVLFGLLAFPTPALRRFLCFPIIAAGFVLFLLGDIEILPFKGREVALNLPDAQVVETHLSPHGTIEVISSDKIRIAPGLSLTFEGELPKQHALYIDGDLLSPLDRIESNTSMDYLLFSTQQAVYELHHRPSVFIAGLGGGISLERSVRNRATTTTVSEHNPHLPKLLQESLSSFNGQFFNRPGITFTSRAARTVLNDSESPWDIIEIPEDVLASSIGGIYASDSNYSLTVQAFQYYLDALATDGTLSATVALKQPPRSLPKLAATAAAALQRRGLAPSHCLMVIRSWATATVLVKKRAFTADEIRRIREFCNTMQFDMVYYRGMHPSQANRFNIVGDSIYYNTVEPVVMGEHSFTEDYVFNVAPATDDRPYFSFFFRIGKLHHLFRETGRRWLFVVEGGYIVLFATCAATMLLAALFILLPPLCLRWNIRGTAISVLVYFSMIAIAFMVIEILLIQTFHRFIANPLYSSSLIIATLLVSTGVTSYLSDRMKRRKRVLMLALTMLSVYVAILLFMIEMFFTKLMGGPAFLEFVLPVAGAAPLGLLMGLFFPMGMSSLKTTHEQALPWAWSINGFFSVIASSGTVLLTSTMGIRATAAIAVACYWVGVAFFPGNRGRL